MTETEFLACPDAERMLAFLHSSRRVSERKLRLFACALGRLLWGRLDQEASRRSVEVAERYADGLATVGQLKAAWTAACLVFDSRGGMEAAGAAANCAYADAAHAAAGAATQARVARVLGATAALREVVGNPFRPAAGHLGWRTPQAVALATAAYEERLLPTGELDRTRLAVLADALEEAGCPDPDILDHLRGPGPHVRGCWPVDLVLNRS